MKIGLQYIFEQIRFDPCRDACDRVARAGEADEANPEMIEFFERCQQMARAACETIELPELGTALPAA